MNAATGQLHHQVGKDAVTTRHHDGVETAGDILLKDLKQREIRTVLAVARDGPCPRPNPSNESKGSDIDPDNHVVLLPEATVSSNRR